MADLIKAQDLFANVIDIPGGLIRGPQWDTAIAELGLTRTGVLVGEQLLAVTLDADTANERLQSIALEEPRLAGDGLSHFLGGAYSNVGFGGRFKAGMGGN